MINDQTILSSFDDKPTLLEWLKKVEDALKTDTATAVSVENPSANTYVFKITFADGSTISSGNVVFPNAVQDVSIKNGHIIVTQISGTQTDLGAINPYAHTIVENAETNTTEIGNNVSISGNVAMGGNLGVTGQAVVGGGLSVNGALGVTGNATIAGRLQTDSSIISNGEIRGGNISGTKFLLGTEEMPLVKANPTGEATETLEKIKIGNVAYKIGGGGENEREVSITMPYSPGDSSNYKKAYINDEIYNKIKNYYYESIKLYFEDGTPIGIFNVFHFHDIGNLVNDTKEYVSLSVTWPSSSEQTWYGTTSAYRSFAEIIVSSDNTGKYLYISQFYRQEIPSLNKASFDALYKLADKPTQDGNYILKASVSGGAVTYTWELQQ